MYSVGRRLSLLNERERRYTISFGAPPALDCPNGPQRVRSVTLQRATIAAEVYDDRPSGIAWMFGAIGGASPSDGAAALSSAGVGALAPSRSRRELRRIREVWHGRATGIARARPVSVSRKRLRTGRLDALVCDPADLLVQGGARILHLLFRRTLGPELIQSDNGDETPVRISRIGATDEVVAELDVDAERSTEDLEPDCFICNAVNNGGSDRIKLVQGVDPGCFFEPDLRVLGQSQHGVNVAKKMILYRPN